MPYKGCSHVDNAFGQAAGIHELTGQNEERHCHQHKVVSAANGVLHHDLRIKLTQLQHDGNA